MFGKTKASKKDAKQKHRWTRRWSKADSQESADVVVNMKKDTEKETQANAKKKEKTKKKSGWFGKWKKTDAVELTDLEIANTEEKPVDLENLEIKTKPDTGKTILAVGTDKAYFHALEVKLQRAWFEVEILHDGADAMDLVREKHFDLLLLDIVLPRMNGFKILENISEENIDIPTMVVSNLGSPEDKEKAETYWVLDFYERKRTTVVDLIRAVNTYFKI